MRHEKVEVTMGLTHPREGSGHNVTRIIGNDSSHIATRVANFGALDAPPRRLPLLPRAYTTQVLVGASGVTSGPLFTS